jgi:hypothetical protein
MKITVLVPSEEYRSYAGARIRYGRLQPKLRELGFELQLEEIDRFDADRATCDVLLISKCHDARSLVIAARMAQRGRVVGVDLFDDYFSQRSDSRLARYRNWFRQLLPNCTFAMCSTPVLADVVRSYRDLPVHVLNDPADDFDIAGMPECLAEKLQEARERKLIRLAWFGVGDNGHFNVGLSDLAGFAGQLRMLRRGNSDVQLTVLTNERALGTTGLAYLAQLSVPTMVEEWSTDRERALLDESLACFVPVNAQPFSAAKSLNRAVTALSAGCQVISAGYPLYAPLDDLIYRDPADFIADLEQGDLRLSPRSMPRLRQAITAIASANAEASALSSFLEGIKPTAPDLAQPIALLHGHQPSGAAHDLVQSLHGFSIASPYCNAQLDFDVVFRGSAEGLVMLVSNRAANRLPASMRQALQPSDRIADRRYWSLSSHRVSSGEEASGPGWEAAPLPFQLATYSATIESIRRQMKEAFGVGDMIVSETSQFPFTVAVDPS